MTREEQVKICANCAHYKHDVQKGIVCKLTGEYATFDTTCSKYEKSTEESELKYAVKHEPAEIKGFFAFFVYWSIPIGVILTLIRMITGFDPSAYATTDFLLAYDVLFTAVYVFTGAYVVYAFVKCKPDAVYMAKYQLFLAFFSNLFALLLEVSESTTLTSVIWSIVFFIYLCFSEDVKDRVPKETRKFTPFSRVYFPVSLIALVLFFLLGLVEVSRGYRFFADPSEKIADICEVVSSTLPDGDFHSMYVDGNSLVYGFDQEFEELSKEDVARLSLTLREGVLADFEIDADTRDFFNLCIEADFDVVYKYTDPNSGTCVIVTITPDVLEKAIQPGYVHVISSEAWNDIMTLYNESLPLEYFEDCYLENVSINDFQKTIRYDLRLVNMSVSQLSDLTTEDFEYHMCSIFDDVSDDVMVLVDYAGYDVEYSFTADCLSWWSKTVTLEHDEIFE
jgi:hypothetical protein